MYGISWNRRRGGGGGGGRARTRPGTRQAPRSRAAGRRPAAGSRAADSSQAAGSSRAAGSTQAVDSPLAAWGGWRRGRGALGARRLGTNAGLARGDQNPGQGEPPREDST